MTNQPAAALITHGHDSEGQLVSDSITLRAYETELTTIGWTPAPGTIAVKKPRARQWARYNFPDENNGIEYGTVEVDGQVVWDSRNCSAPREETTEEAPEITPTQTGEAAFQVMPDLTADELEALRVSIEHTAC
jgi:hypothetical protein